MSDNTTTREDLLVEHAHLREHIKKLEGEILKLATEILKAKATLRDEFAKAAPITDSIIEAAIDSVERSLKDDTVAIRLEALATQLAEWSYWYADAMLAEREKHGGHQ